MASISKLVWYPCSPSMRPNDAVKIHMDPDGQRVVYGHGRAVIIRPISGVKSVDTFLGHTTQVSVTRFSPSGYYIASGDHAGQVKIWDATQPSHIVKTDTRPLRARVNDLAWDNESKRLAIVGEGRDRMGQFILMDTGSSAGDIVGHLKQINACAMRPCRPYRAVTASDDFSIGFYHGAPYKLTATHRDHTHFVQDVSYNCDGSYFATASADHRVLIYDGVEGTKASELLGHTSSVIALAFHMKDPLLLVSMSLDGAVRLWHIQTKACLYERKFPTRLLGCLWITRDDLLFINQQGDFIYTNKSFDTQHTVYTHEKSIVACNVIVQDNTVSLLTGDVDGRVIAWALLCHGNGINPSQGEATTTEGKQTHHTNGDHDNPHPPNQCLLDRREHSVVAIVSQGTDTYVLQSDGTLTLLPTQRRPIASSLHVGADVKSMAFLETGQCLLLLSTQALLSVVYDRTASTPTLKIGTLRSWTGEFRATALSLSRTHGIVLDDEGHMHLYEVSALGDMISPEIPCHSGTLFTSGSVQQMALNHAGTRLAVATADHAIAIYSIPAMTRVGGLLSHHTARVTRLCWSTHDDYLASTSLDTSVVVWHMASDEPMFNRAVMRHAHVDCVNDVAFVSDSILATVGSDAMLKTWQFTLST